MPLPSLKKFSTIIGTILVVTAFIAFPVFIIKSRPNPPTQKALITPNLYRNPNSAPTSYSAVLNQAQTTYQTAYQLWQENPNNPKVTRLLNQAINLYQQAITLDPDNPKAYYQVGQLYDSIQTSFPKAAQQAEIAYKKAYEKDPKNDKYLNTLALFLIKNQKLLQAKIYLENSTAFNDKNIDALLLLARVYRDLGQIQPAIKTLTRIKPLIQNQPIEKEVNLQLKLLKKLAQVISPSTTSPTPTFQPTLSLNPSPTPASLDLDKLPTQQASSNKLVIAAPTDNQDQSLFDTTNTNSTQGKAIFPKGKLTLNIEHPAVTPNSKIITAIEDDTTFTVFVKQKQTGQFTLAAPTAPDKDLTIAYWIVNQ